MEIDYCAILGVMPDASHDEIRSAYRRLAMKWHPDRFMSAGMEERRVAEEMFKKINQAYHGLQRGERSGMWQDASERNASRAAYGSQEQPRREGVKTERKEDGRDSYRNGAIWSSILARIASAIAGIGVCLYELSKLLLKLLLRALPVIALLVAAIIVVKLMVWAAGALLVVLAILGFAILAAVVLFLLYFVFTLVF